MRELTFACARMSVIQPMVSFLCVGCWTIGKLTLTVWKAQRYLWENLVDDSGVHFLWGWLVSRILHQVVCSAETDQ